MQPEPTDHWDAGDMGCGELILKLKMRIRSLSGGSILWLRATDSGAVEDIPAWCQMTGNPLLQQQHPEYWIQKKGESDAR